MGQSLVRGLDTEAQGFCRWNKSVFTMYLAYVRPSLNRIATGDILKRALCFNHQSPHYTIHCHAGLK